MMIIRRAGATAALLGLFGSAGCGSEANSIGGNDAPEIGSVGLEINLCARCNDGNPCTVDTCVNPTTGACSFAPASTATVCDDKNACTTDDRCNGAGTCRGSQINCNDNNPCTNDSCYKATGCAYANNTAVCNDNSKCTTSDRCASGVCTGTLKSCDDGNPCTNDSCNPVTGVCTHTNNTAPCSDDGNVCTNDVCSAGGCAHPSNSAPCVNDGNPCTNDICAGGSCTHPSNNAACNDNNECTLSDQCSAGNCGGAARDCNDNDPCTDDACDVVSGCAHTDNGSCATTAIAWPGTNNVVAVDASNAFPSNLSGLNYEPAGATPAVLWAVRNSPSTLYQLVWNGSIWTPQTTSNWSSGKSLRYTTGTGSPDAEGVTRAEYSSTAIYVVTERNNDVSGTSRMSVLRFDTSTAGTSLTATHEWNLTSDLPAAGSNVGLEAITWIPDSALVAKSFYDEAAAHTYNPAEYPNHGTGLFLVGVEATGLVYAYALNHTSSTFQRIATISSGHVGVMGLEFDRDVGVLWAACDDTCDNESSVLDIDTKAGSPTLGRYKVRRKFARPSTLEDFNNEGIAIAPESECSAGMKPFFWSDDSNNGGHALRRDAIPCGSLF